MTPDRKDGRDCEQADGGEDVSKAHPRTPDRDHLGHSLTSYDRRRALARPARAGLALRVLEHGHVPPLWLVVPYRVGRVLPVDLVVHPRIVGM